jgi:hypothetical protein
LTETFQPTNWHHIWLCFKSFFELLYFIAGIVIGIAAVYAAKQVRIASQQLDAAKEIAKSAARREAVKLAGDKCEYFAENVVSAQNDAVNAYVAGHCTFLDPTPLQPGAQAVPAFTIVNGDFAQPIHYDVRRITPEQWNSVKAHMVMFLNKLETFAIPFAAGVADDVTGFQETAPVFIGLMNTFMPVIYFLRQTQGARYASILKLFTVWNTRVAANVLAQVMPGLQRMIDEAGTSQIPPI